MRIIGAANYLNLMLEGRQTTAAAPRNGWRKLIGMPLEEPRVKAPIGSRFPHNPAELSPNLRRLFPDAVAAAEMRAPADARWLFPEEADGVRRAVPKRVGEFAAGRACARRALAEIGIAECAIPIAPDRQPIWPAAAIGSISHTTGLYAAVVARKSRLAGVGLDCEEVGKVTADIRQTISRPEELRWVDSLPPDERSAAVALVFSAKEAFYKCQYPLTHQWLDFHDIRIEPRDWGVTAGGAAAREFEVHLMRPLAIARHAAVPLLGKYEFQDGFVMSGVALPHRN